MSEAASIRADLIDLFAENGRALEVQRPVQGTYDETTGTVVYGSGEDENSVLSYPGVGRVGTYRDALIDGALIKQNDRLVTFVATDATFVPQVDDKLVAGADVYTIISLKPRELGGEWICFTLQVRR